MPNQNIGITAMELFACNPYRVLGIAVNSSETDIKQTYEKIVHLAENDQIESYKTNYDFPSLPPYARTAKSINTAYAKLASNGYRCFAYAHSEFTTALNIDDVALNLRDITCYDCFLRCYMWLVINDRNMEETQLWIQLANYIDKLIHSKQNSWAEYFDNRFPDEMIDDHLTVYKSFYITFCEIILLPLKEMVRGSMKCSSAIEILKIKGIDINEVFEFIEIPQANVPKDGETPPRMKLALKDGDEFFDIATGKMMSFGSSADIESHHFDEVAPVISADVLLEDEEDVPPATSPAESDGFVNTKPVTFSSFKKDDDLDESEYITSAKSDNNHSEPTAAPKLIRGARRSTNTSSSSGSSVKFKKINKQSTSLVDSNNDGVYDLSEVILTDTSENEESNQYTDALIEMLRANKNKNLLMKNVDTTHIFDNGDTLGSAEPDPEMTMDNINMNKYDSSLLASPYEDQISPDKSPLEQKYGNIKIDDMLNPTLGPKYKGGYEVDAIEEYKRDKAYVKSLQKAIAMLFLALVVIGGIYFGMKFLDIL